MTCIMNFLRILVEMKLAVNNCSKTVRYYLKVKELLASSVLEFVKFRNDIVSQEFGTFIMSPKSEIELNFLAIVKRADPQSDAEKRNHHICEVHDEYCSKDFSPPLETSSEGFASKGHFRFQNASIPKQPPNGFLT